MIDRLVTKIDMAGDCWTWTGARSANGYGNVRMSNPRRNVVAHRVVYELVVEPIPEGLTIDHLCFNKSCVNPDHLELTTTRENTQRYWRRYWSRFSGE